MGGRGGRRDRERARSVGKQVQPMGHSMELIACPTGSRCNLSSWFRQNLNSPSCWVCAGEAAAAPVRDGRMGAGAASALRGRKVSGVMASPKNARPVVPARRGAWRGARAGAGGSWGCDPAGLVPANPWCR